MCVTAVTLIVSGCLLDVFYKFTLLLLISALFGRIRHKGFFHSIIFQCILFAHGMILVFVMHYLLCHASLAFILYCSVCFTSFDILFSGLLSGSV